VGDHTEQRKPLAVRCSCGPNADLTGSISGGKHLHHFFSIFFISSILVGGLAYDRVSSAFRLAGDWDAISFGLTGNEITRALRTGILSPTCRLREDRKRSEQAGGE
jgi:hypothetical protein